MIHPSLKGLGKTFETPEVNKVCGHAAGSGTQNAPTQNHNAVAGHPAHGRDIP